jgi:hypothetical protein
MLDPSVPAATAIPAPAIGTPANGVAEHTAVPTPTPQAAAPQARPTTGQAVPLSMDPTQSAQQPAAAPAAAPQQQQQPQRAPKKGFWAKVKGLYEDNKTVAHVAGGIVAGVAVTNARNNRPAAPAPPNGTVDHRER